jgi:hypothetical protein
VGNAAQQPDWLRTEARRVCGPSISIGGGTDEIQRNIVGGRALGLRPEQRADVDVRFSRRPRTAR